MTHTTDTNQASELYELCKKVYELTGWEAPETYKAEDGNPENDWQAYDTDYLLEKLPKNLTSFYGKAYPLSPQVMASGDMYYAMYKHDMTGPKSEETMFEVEADTPLKSLLKLTIALSEAGELNE